MIASASSTSRAVGAPYDVPSRRGALHRLDDRRIGVAEDRRAPRLHVVDVAVALGVDELRALGPVHEERRAADRVERPHRRAHARRGSRPAPRYSSSRPVTRRRQRHAEEFGDGAGEVGEHEVGAGAPDREQVLDA